MRKLLLDLNVVLDILLNREPHVAVSAALWAKIEKGAATGFLPAHGFTAIHYLIARERDAKIARQALETIVHVLEVAPVDGAVIRVALTLAWPDYEDAVCAAAAQTNGCDAIVTRDPKGFPNSPVPVIDPETALAWLMSE